MIVIDAPFRCNLCGKHRRRGVMETDPKDPTRVCVSCIKTAVIKLLALVQEEESAATLGDG